MGPKFSSAATPSSVRVTVEVSLPTGEPDPAEWIFVETAQARGTPVGRITAAWKAGQESRDRDLAIEDLVRPPSIGISNGCWLGVRGLVRKKAADSILKRERSTRLIAFPSQAEAEAWVLGFGLDGAVMPWRAVGVRCAGTLRIAESSGELEWMLLRLSTPGARREAAVVPVLRRCGGLLLAMAAEVFTAPASRQQIQVGASTDGRTD